MESKTIAPAQAVSGRLDVPGDKSISHRAVMLGALSNRVCTVDNFLLAEDCLRTVEAFHAMGVVIESSGAHLSIHGKGLDGLKRPAGSIQCGNSGTTARLLMGVLTGQPFDVQLIGDASLSRRPMDRLVKPLSQMGAFFLDAPGAGLSAGQAHLPLRMRGTRDVRSIHWKSPVASAQVKSAILLAGLYASGATTVEEPSLSRDHTERMLQASGVQLERQGARVTVYGTATVRASAFRVPGDLSSAAFLLAAGLLKGTEVVVRGVGVNPTRTGFIEIVKAMGGFCRLLSTTESGGEPIADVAVKASPLKGVVIGGDVVARAIDEIPILTVLATQAQGRTVIRDAQELRVKESDRLSVLREELSKMGARIAENPDGLVIEGPTPLAGTVVRSHGDHRLAMSLAVAALIAGGATTIEDVACVATSFPSFWGSLDRMRVSS